LAAQEEAATQALDMPQKQIPAVVVAAAALTTVGQIRAVQAAVQAAISKRQ
jgi:hypothetical protein